MQRVLGAAVALGPLVPLAALLMAQTQTEDATSFVSGLYPFLEAAQCRICHTDGGVASETRLQFPREGAPQAEVVNFGLSLARFVDRARPENSVLLRKPTNRVPHTGGERIRRGSEEERALQAWIWFLAARPETAAESQPAAARPPAYPVRRLTHSQYNNTVRDLLGDTTRPADRFPKEDFVHGFTNQVDGQSVSPLLAEAYNAAAERLARNAFRGGDARGLIPCRFTGPRDTACRDRFIREFGRRAFRRPLSATETARYAELHALEAGRAGDFVSGVRIVVEAMLQSPNFLFHIDSGRDGDQYRVAGRLSYFLWDTMPDDALFELAENRRLGTREQIRSAVLRMLQHERARDAMGEFLRQWMRFDRLRAAIRDLRLFPEYSAELAAAMEEETRRLFDHLVWGDEDFREFYTARYTFLSSSLARHYNLPAPAEEFAKTALPPGGPRAGVLGHASFLTLTSKPADTSPTERGLFVREHFLCQTVPPPPPGVDTTLPALTDEKPLSMRQRLDVHLSNAACAGCHRLVDPIGFGLERFDATGKFRAKEVIQIHPTADEIKRKSKTKPTEYALAIDSTGHIQGLSETRFASPAELGDLLAAQQACQECVARQLFRYAMGRKETADDRETIAAAFRPFRDSRFRFRELIIAIVTSSAFLAGAP